MPQAYFLIPHDVHPSRRLAVTNPQKSYLLAFITTLIWSTVATSNKMALTQLNNYQLWFVSTTTCLIFLGIVLFIQKKFRIIRGMPRHDLLYYAKLGLMNPFICYLVIFKAYSLLPGQIASPIVTSWTVVLPVLSIPFLKKVPSTREWTCIAVAFLGMLIVASNGSLKSFEQVNVTGIGMGLGSTVLWSFFWLYNTKSRYDPVVALFLCFAFAFPFILIATLFLTDLPSVDQFFPGVLCAMYTGLSEMGVPYLTWFAAMRYTDSPARISTMILLCPAISLIFLSTIYGESILFTTVFGLMLTVLSNIYQQKDVICDIVSQSKRFLHRKAL